MPRVHAIFPTQATRGANGPLQLRRLRSLGLWVRKMLGDIERKMCLLMLRFNNQPVTVLAAKHTMKWSVRIKHIDVQCYFVRDDCQYGLGMALNSSMRAMRPGSNPGLPRATSRLLARAPGRVAYWVSGGLPFTNCMCIPSCGARPKC
jgi:hypothetical protein